MDDRKQALQHMAKGAILATAKGMESAVVMQDDKHVQTLSAEVAENMERDGLVQCTTVTPRAVKKYIITPEGKRNL